MFDITIVGAGVVGCSIARELNLIPTEVTKFGGESKFLVGKDKEII